MNTNTNMSRKNRENSNAILVEQFMSAIGNTYVADRSELNKLTEKYGFQNIGGEVFNLIAKEVAKRQEMEELPQSPKQVQFARRAAATQLVHGFTVANVLNSLSQYDPQNPDAKEPDEMFWAMSRMCLQGKWDGEKTPDGQEVTPANFQPIYDQSKKSAADPELVKVATDILKKANKSKEIEDTGQAFKALCSIDPETGEEVQPDKEVFVEALAAFEKKVKVKLPKSPAAIRRDEITKMLHKMSESGLREFMRSNSDPRQPEGFAALRFFDEGKWPGVNRQEVFGPLLTAFKKQKDAEKNVQAAKDSVMQANARDAQQTNGGNTEQTTQQRMNEIQQQNQSKGADNSIGIG